MLALYLFCLIVGGGLLLFSVIGNDGDGHHAGLDGGTMAHEFFSVRALSYLLAGFGATGFLVGSLTDTGAVATAAWAVATGLLAAGAASLVYGWLRSSESGVLATTSEHLAGLPARVLLPVTQERRGKVVAVYGGREIELLARLHGEADPECPRGSTVVIVDIQGDTALVTPAGFLPS